MKSKENGIKNLQLYGEHINLSSRTRFGDDTKKFRPQSALYTTTKYTPEHSRRPFSAGTEPTSPKLLSFLRHTQTDRPESYHLRNSEHFKDLSIPGTVESSALCEKLIKEPLYSGSFIKRKFYYEQPELCNISDNCSENSSLETCISLGAKIKAKAQILDKCALDVTNYEIEGTSMHLKKVRPLEKYFDSELFKKSLHDIPEKDHNSSNSSSKLFINLAKEENTSSGVSSSSDVHTFCNLQNRKPLSEFQDNNGHLNKYEPYSQYRFKKPSNLFMESSITDYDKDIGDMNLSKTNVNGDFNMEDQGYNKSPENLVGRVSFAKQQDDENVENFDDSCDFFSNFDTQLSLVEEESSQDSDKSPNVLSSEYKMSRLINTKTFSPHVSVEYISQYETKNDENDPIQFKSTVNPTDKVCLNYSREKMKPDEDEHEMRYKALENKYKSESKLKQSSNLQFFEDKRTVSQNTTCPDNDNLPCGNLQSQKQETPVKINGLYDNLYDYDKNIEPTMTNSTYKENNESKNVITDINVGSFLSESVDENKNHQSLKDKYDIDKKLDSYISKQKVETKVHDFLDNDAFDQENRAETNSQIPKEYYNSKDTYLDKNSLLEDNNAYNKTTECNFVEEKPDYPQYLEENEIKSYTSKVIEEYKQEIASINNFHNITLQDLRNKCSNLKNKIGFSPLPTKNFKSNNSISEDDMDNITPVSEFMKEKTKSFKDNYKMMSDTKNIDTNKSQRNYTFKNVDKDEHTHKSCNSYSKEKQKTTKTKKKTKKKDSSFEYKNKHPNDETKAKRSNYPKKNYNDVKNKEENSSYFPKTKSSVKIKAQKIMLSKSSTKINHTVYLNDDRDVISWMATRINTPSGDMSSCENTERNKSFKDSKLNEKPNRNSVHFEDEIVAIPKSDSFFVSGESNVQNVKNSDILKTDSKNDDLIHSDSEIDIMKFSPPSDFSNSSEKFDLDNNLEMNVINEDNSMVGDIYSTLYDIESHYNATNKDMVVTNDKIDENVTTEFKDIASYLEKMEKNADEEMSSLSHNQPLFALKVEELMELSKAELAHRAVVNVLAAGRASAIASGLKGALTQAAKVSAARLKAIKASAKQEATIAAAQTTQTLSKHQKFIEQLVNEKQALTERIEQLAGAAAGAEARRGRAARVAAERLQLELRNQRQRLNAAHQRDKQAWLKHHTTKIKEMTVKELEGELKEIEKKHNAQIEKLQRDADFAIIELREEHSKEVRKLKDIAARQLEDELNKERLLATERLEQKRVEWEAAMLNASERASLDAKDAARRVEEAVRNVRRESELWKMEQEEELMRQKRSSDKQIDEQKNIIKEEIKQYKEKMTKEFENYKMEYLENQEIVLKEKEAEIKLLLRRERDKEIEKAIDCMEKDAEEARKEMQETIRKIKEKFESEKNILENSEKSVNQRCVELREQIGILQEQCSKYQITITQLEGKLKQAEETINQNAVQKEISLKAAELKGQENLQEIQNKMQDLQKRHKDEMHQLFAKVKVVIARKDEAITLAKRETATFRERCIRLEAKNILK